MDFSKAKALEIEAYIQKHPLVQEFQQSEYIILTRPCDGPPISFQSNTLANSLTGLNKISTPAYRFHNTANGEFYAVFHLGDQVCDQPGFVHSGLMDILMDEAVAHLSFLTLPGRLIMTAKLGIKHHIPCKANTYVIMKAGVTKLEGRKIWVWTRLEDLPEVGEGRNNEEQDAKVLVEATALLIDVKAPK